MLHCSVVIASQRTFLGSSQIQPRDSLVPKCTSGVHIVHTDTGMDLRAETVFQREGEHYMKFLYQQSLELSVSRSIYPMCQGQSA